MIDAVRLRVSMLYTLIVINPGGPQEGDGKVERAATHLENGSKSRISLRPE